MCGVVAWYSNNAQDSISKLDMAQMVASLKHRGPDDDGVYSDQGIALGHTRLSVIDLSDGHQPMLDVTERAVISFNGEIYNFQTLRTELEQLGYHFRTN